MLRKKIKSFFMVMLIMVSQATAKGKGLNLFHPDAMGGCFVAMRQDAAQIHGSGAGPGLEVFLKYKIQPIYFLSLSTGFNTVTDDMFKMKNFKSTLVPSFELKTGYTMINRTKLLPFFYTGFHLYGCMSKTKTPSGIKQVGQFFDSAFIVGGGFEYVLNYKWSFYFSADYRYGFTAADPKPQYWVAKAGLSIAMLETNYYPGIRKEDFPLNEKNLAFLETLQKEQKEVKNKESPNREYRFKPQSETVQNEIKNDFISPFEANKILSHFKNLQNQDIKNSIKIKDIQDRILKDDKMISLMVSKVRGAEQNRKNRDRVSFSNVANYNTRYQEGLDYFYARKYREAIQVFRRLLELDPKHKLATNCQYWIGENYNALGDYQKAIESFEEVLKNEISTKFDDALLMNGLCQLKLGNRSNARERFQELVDRYPDSEYISKAQRYLNRM